MRNVSRAIVQGIAEMVLVLPVFLAICAYFLSPRDMPLWLILLWAVGMTGFVLSPIIDRLHVLFAVIVQITLSFSIFIFVYGSSFAGWIGGLIGCAAFLRGVIYARYPWQERIPPSYIWYGVLFYFFASFLFMFFDRYEPLLPFIYVFGSLNLFAALIANNAFHLRMEAGFSKGINKVSKDVKRQNIFYLVLFLLVVFVLWVTGAVRALFIVIRDVLLYWLTNRAGDFEGSDEHMPPLIEELPLFDDAAQPSEPSWLDHLLSILVYIAGGAITLFLLFLLLRTLLKAALKMIAWILVVWSRRGEKKSSEPFGYVDEKNVLFKLNARPKLQRWTRRISTNWGRLKSNRERIRFLYTNLVTKAMKEGFAFRKNDTPTETIRKIYQQQSLLDVHAADLLEREYNKARYGQTQPADQAVQTLREKLR